MSFQKKIKLLQAAILISAVTGWHLNSALAADKKKSTSSKSASFENSSSDSGSSLFDSSAYSGAKRELSLSSTNSTIINSNNNTNMSLNGEYKHTIAAGMQVGGIFNMVVANSNGTNNTYMGIWGSFTYNFNKSWDVTDSFFATGALGLMDEALSYSGGQSATSEKKFSYLAYAGKRFTLFNRINYVPQGGIRKVGSTDLAVVIMPINFSILF